MGTNYYAVIPTGKNTCPKCGRSDGDGERLHIGKSSGGWCFSLHVIPERGLDSLEDWKRLLQDPTITIRDEYDGVDVISREVLYERIENRCVGDGKLMATDGQLQVPPYSYSDWAEFHRRNYSEPGPNGLVRHKISKENGCIGHGDGTWDLVLGEFT